MAGTPDDGATTRVLGSGPGRVVVDVSAGPRVTSLLGVDGDELLVELDPPEVVGPEDGTQAGLHGGHRLWVAPEVPAVTYAMADGPGAFAPAGPGADGDATAIATDAGRPFSRTLRVTATGGSVRLAHGVTNHGESSTVAPWAVTQVRPGGIVVLPVGTAPRDPHGLQASGGIVTWPYTDLRDPRIDVGVDAVVLATRAGADDPVTKVGVDGFVPWAAYVLGPTVLVVHREPRTDDATYADLGAATQAFVGPRFVEVEALGPLAPLAPGATCTLDLTWTVHERTWDGDGIDPDAVAEIATAAATA